MSVRIITGDALTELRKLPGESVHCCVTSPPYYGLRDYGVIGQIGLEPSPDEYVASLVAVFREVRRVLRKDGTLWLNIGDSYAGSAAAGNWRDGAFSANGGLPGGRNRNGVPRTPSAKPKDLLGIPWMLAFALRADGWWLRQDIIWSKPNPMPESVTDRCTKAHEYLFLLSKSERYWFDAEAIREANSNPELTECHVDWRERPNNGEWPSGTGGRMGSVQNGRNKRSVWTVAGQPFAESHFATFPPALIEPCIMAGCPKDGTVLDPFGGAGTTGLVADRLGRDALLIELNPEYAQMAERRLHNDAPLFADVAMHPPASECAA